MDWKSLLGGKRRPSLRRASKPQVESLDGRQLLSALASRPSAARPAESATPTLRVYKAVVQPRAGRVLVTFQGARGGIDPASIQGAVSLVRLQSPRRDFPLTLVGTPQVLPSVYEPLPTPPTGPSLQTVGAVFDVGTPLPRGNYIVKIVETVQDAAGRPLDGEFRGRFPTGDGVPGGNFVANFPTNGFFEYRPRAVGRTA